jgi:alpha-maltose-1-phosphate synthase
VKAGPNLRINFVTTTRFHVADLARELADLGNEITFYSISPPWTLRRFCGPKVKIRTFFWLFTPLLFLARTLRSFQVAMFCDFFIIICLDRLVANLQKKCDVVVGMSGVGLSSLLAAKRKFGALAIVERGSRHIVSQQRILGEITSLGGGVQLVPNYVVRREVATYNVADLISIPSVTVLESFLEEKVSSQKLFVNPYGVSIAEFQPLKAPPSSQPTAIMVGTWSYQKGCDLIPQIWSQLTTRARLIHVGDIGDCPIPKNEDWFEHHDPVDQSHLPEFYARAHVQILVSRQEGLAMVQAQGLSCGLMLVCTRRTGGEDLRGFIDAPERIIVANVDRPDEIARSIDRAFTMAFDPSFERRSPVKEDLSWGSYAKRYHERLTKALKA